MAESVPALYRHNRNSVAWRLAAAPQLPMLVYQNAVLDRSAEAPWIDLVGQTVSSSIFLGLFTICVGYPIYKVFQWLKLSWPVLFVATAAAIPFGLYALPELVPDDPNRSFSYSTRDCRVIVDDERTPCGWEMYNEGQLANLIGGAAAGLILYGLLRMPVTDPSKRQGTKVL